MVFLSNCPGAFLVGIGYDAKGVDVMPKRIVIVYDGRQLLS